MHNRKWSWLYINIMWTIILSITITENNNNESINNDRNDFSTTNTFKVRQYENKKIKFDNNK